MTDWADVSTLGRAIVSQLSISEPDTLGRWMAYRLAELLNQAETDDSAKEAATDLVFRIWRHRSDWPNGWPPTAVAGQLAWLFPPDQRRAQWPVGSRKRLMRDITDSLTKEYRFWLRFSSQHGLDLTPEEETILSVEPEPAQYMMRWLMELNDQQETEPTAQDAQERLESILRARRALLETALDSVAKASPDAPKSEVPDTR